MWLRSKFVSLEDGSHCCPGLMPILQRWLQWIGSHFKRRKDSTAGVPVGCELYKIEGLLSRPKGKVNFSSKVMLFYFFGTLVSCFILATIKILKLNLFVTSALKSYFVWSGRCLWFSLLGWSFRALFPLYSANMLETLTILNFHRELNFFWRLDLLFAFNLCCLYRHKVECNNW